MVHMSYVIFMKITVFAFAVQTRHDTDWNRALAERERERERGRGLRGEK